MESFMDMSGRGFILGFLGLFLLWKWLSKSSPEVTDTATKLGKKKAIDFLTKLLK